MSDREFENYLALLTRLLSLGGKQRQQIAGELRAHLEDRLSELMASGIERDDAVRLALEEFGDAAGLAASFGSVTRNRRRRWLMRLTTFSVAATVLLAAGIVTFWPGRNAGPGVANLIAQDPKPADTRVSEVAINPEGSHANVAKTLNQRMNVDFVGLPLKDVAAYLTEETGVTFHLKAKKLEEASLSPDTPIFCKFRDIRLSTLLELMLDELELTYVEKDGLILITTPEDAESKMDIRVYDCRDLLAMPSPDLEKKNAPTAIPGSAALPAPVRRDEGKGEVSRGGFGGANLNGATQATQPQRPPTEYEDRTESLIDLVTIIVDPSTWDDVGGPGSIEAYNGLIVVAQTDETHRRVEEVFDMLRQAAGLDMSKAGRVVRKSGI
jgi:hypothetical protein